MQKISTKYGDGFDTLPLEMLIEIALYMDVKTLGVMQHVSKAWKKVTESEFWEKKFAEQFPHLVKEVKEKKDPKKINWREKFRKAYNSEYNKLHSEIRLAFTLVKAGNIKELKQRLSLLEFWDSKDRNGKSLYDWVTVGGSKEIIELFDIRIEYEKKLISYPSSQKDFITNLGWAIKYAQPIDEVKKYIRNLEVNKSIFLPQNFPIQCGLFNTPVHLLVLFAEREHRVGVDALLANRSTNINAYSRINGITALLAALLNQHDEIVILLLQQPNINVTLALTDSITVNGKTFLIGTTPLHVAVIMHQTKIALKILEKTSNLEVRDEEGNTCLILAALHGNQTLVEELQKAGALINQQNKRGMSPLLAAILGEHVALATWLLEHGAIISTVLTQTVQVKGTYFSAGTTALPCSGSTRPIRFS